MTHFGSVSNHFPKKFHFSGKLLSLCSTSNKIIWQLGGNGGKVGRGKTENLQKMCLLHLCITLLEIDSFYLLVLFSFLFLF